MTALSDSIYRRGKSPRAWGLALRKRFCRKFNFELQAAATEDNIVLSLTTAHSFELAEVARYLNSGTVRELLIQAMLDAPMFITRWRWVAGVALALPRFQGGKKVPAQLTRMGAEDLIGTVFPDQIACAENLVGEREIPDHPLVNQTIADCLTEAMDLAGLTRLLRRIEGSDIRVVARDLTEPSPFGLEVLSARPYAYLDDAPLEERRAQAVMGRRWLNASMMAEVEAEAGRTSAALSIADETLGRVERSGQHWFDAEAHRIRGEVLLKHEVRNSTAAEAAFMRAMQIARGQQARTFRLRAAMSMARLWRDQGKRDEARDLLAPVYGWFTEGFETLDLKEAKALLDELVA